MDESIKLLEKQEAYHRREMILCSRNHPLFGTIAESMEHKRLADDFAQGLAALKLISNPTTKED